MPDKISERLIRLYSSPAFPWLIIGIGIILRLARYLHNPSLYFDEAGTAVDLAERPFHDLINPSPDAISSYPLTFLYYTKYAVHILGNTEYALRLFPLIFGIASLFLFFYVARKLLSTKAVPAALLLFAILDSLVYYSSIVKPYSGDVFFSLLIFSALAHYQSKDDRTLPLFILILSGAVSVWFSNPSVFVLAGAGTYLIFSALQKKDRKGAMIFAMTGILWAASFLANYTMVVNRAMADIGADVEVILQRESALFPFPPTSLTDLKWFIDTFFDTFNFMDIFDSQQGLTLTGIGALLFILGAISMYTKKKDRLLTIISPVIFTLAAAAMHKYPFKGRMILFLTPFFLLIIAEGLYYLYEKTRESSKAIAVIVMIFLFIYPVSWASYHLKKPLAREDIVPSLQHIRNNWKEGDVLYVHFYAQYEFDYYTQMHPEAISFSDEEYIIGIAPRGWYKIWKRQNVEKYYGTKDEIKQDRSDILNEYIKDLGRLEGHARAWFIFTEDIVSTRGIRDESFFRYQLDTKWEHLDSFELEGAATAYLYDLGTKPQQLGDMP